MNKKVLVRDIMNEPVATVDLDAKLEDIARHMLVMDIGSILVVDAAGSLQGIITDSNFIAKQPPTMFSQERGSSALEYWREGGAETVYSHARARPAREVMSAPVVTLREDDSLETVLTLMQKHGVRHLPVVRDDRPVGIVTSRDLLILLIEERES